MMKRIQFLMLGGFLGSGKTTAIARIAQQLTSEGNKVGIVTNDQAYDLVDTKSLRSQGFSVGEVPGACFCCKFEDLVATVERLREEQFPDVILAEPVGSCTDLVATVIEPLRQLHGGDYELTRLAILLKPEHARKIFGSDAGGFSAKAAYIFLKQIEEASIVAVNKIDRLSPSEREQQIQWVHQHYPGKRVLAVSARTGEGFTELISAMRASSQSPPIRLELDYDRYAEGEAELGWLNSVVDVDAGDGWIQLDDLVHRLTDRVKKHLGVADAEPAHLKILVQSDDHLSVANLVDASAAVELSRDSQASAHAVQITINARVVGDPAIVETIVRTVLAQVCSADGLSFTVERMQSFRPARPTPTHRLVSGSHP